MAIVKTLIVKGVARFLTDAYMSTIRSGIWNGSTIQVGYGGTGVTSGVGSASIPVYLSATGLQPCTSNISSAVVASSATATTLITAATNSPYFNLINGSSVARSIRFNAGTCMGIQSTTAGVITFSVTANAAGVAGYVAAPSATNDKNKVWMTNSSGVPAWRAVSDITGANATLLFSGAKTLIVSEWTTIASVSGLAAGTYAIQINSGALYASGIFSACAGTDAITDEIPLHVSSTSSTWRPYARISGANLEMASNEATGTSRTYTVKISKLI